MAIVLLIIAVLILWKIRKNILETTIKIRKNNVIAFTGSLGTGKTYLSVKTAIRLYKESRKKNKGALLYSNIPIKLSRNRYSEILSNDILMLQKTIPKGSVVLIDEIGQYVSQFDFKANNTLVLEEFMRLYRHYTQGGYLIVNDQSINNIELHIRRRINVFYNLLEMVKFPFHMRIECKEILNAEDNNTIVNKDLKMYIRTMKSLRRYYDTYVYSGRYNMPERNIPMRWWKLKTNYVMRLPRKEIYPKTLGKDLDNPYTNNSESGNIITNNNITESDSK